MKTLILTVPDVKAIVRRVTLHALMDEMIARLRAACSAYDPAATIVPTRAGFTYTDPDLGLIEWMPIMQQGGRVTIKVVGYHPANPARHGLPTIVSTVSAYDTGSGHLAGLTDGTFLTALRTGAASALASQVLARPDSRVIGLIGAGAQAVAQLHALSRIFDIEKVLVYDLDPAVTQSFSRRTGFLGLEIVPVTREWLPRLVEEADILTTATSVEVGRGPVFSDNGCKETIHINAVGSDFPGKFEIPLPLLQRSFVCPDFREQAEKEGECQQLNPEEIGPSLAEVVRHPEKYETVWQRRSVFDSTGWALEDQVAMELLLDYAREMGLGTAVELEHAAADPRDPYEEMSGAVPADAP